MEILDSAQRASRGMTWWMPVPEPPGTLLKMTGAVLAHPEL